MPSRFDGIALTFIPPGSAGLASYPYIQTSYRHTRRDARALARERADGISVTWRDAVIARRETDKAVRRGRSGNRAVEIHRTGLTSFAQQARHRGGGEED